MHCSVCNALLQTGMAERTSNDGFGFDLKEKQTYGSRLPVLHCWVSKVTAGIAAAA